MCSSSALSFRPQGLLWRLKFGLASFSRDVHVFLFSQVNPHLFGNHTFSEALYVVFPFLSVLTVSFQLVTCCLFHNAIILSSVSSCHFCHWAQELRNRHPEIWPRMSWPAYTDIFFFRKDFKTTPFPYVHPSVWKRKRSEYGTDCDGTQSSRPKLNYDYCLINLLWKTLLPWTWG
jgi:hypothetical protein